MTRFELTRTGDNEYKLQIPQEYLHDLEKHDGIDSDEVLVNELEALFQQSISCVQPVTEDKTPTAITSWWKYWNQDGDSFQMSDILSDESADERIEELEQQVDDLRRFQEKVERMIQSEGDSRTPADYKKDEDEEYY